MQCHMSSHSYRDKMSDGMDVLRFYYYPNLVILPVDNNEYQRIDDVSTDRISYDIRSVETMGFAL